MDVEGSKRSLMSNQVNPHQDRQSVGRDSVEHSDQSLERAQVRTDRYGRRTKRLNSNGSYVIDDEIFAGRYKVGRRNNRVKPKRTEILYIRSPLHAMQSEDRSISEAALRLNDIDESASSAEIARTRSRNKAKRQVSFKESNDNLRETASVTDSEVFPEKLERHRSVSNMTLNSQQQAIQPVPPERRPSLLVTTPSDPMSPAGPATHEIITGTPGVIKRHASLPGSVDDELVLDHPGDATTEPKAVYGDNVQIVDDRHSPTVPDIPPPDYDVSDQLPSVQPTTRLQTEVGQAKESASDTDSGIGNTRTHVSELNLKNSALMQKKSIFTQAYDGMKTTRLKSAESGDSS